MNPKEYKTCILKQPKFRSRFEVYIFNKEFLKTLEPMELKLDLPGMEEPLRLQRKMMFKSEGLAILVASILDKIQTILRGVPDFDLQKWLGTQASKCRKLSEEEEDGSGDWIKAFIKKNL